MPGTTDGSGEPGGGRWRRLAWFGLLYLAGLAAMLLLAYGLKALIPGL